MTDDDSHRAEPLLQGIAGMNDDIDYRSLCLGYITGCYLTTALHAGCQTLDGITLPNDDDGNASLIIADLVAMSTGTTLQTRVNSTGDQLEVRFVL